MTVQNQMLFLPVFISIHLPPSVKYRVSVMNDTVMIGADNYLITGIIIETLYEIINMMSFRNMRTEFLAD